MPQKSYSVEDAAAQLGISYPYLKNLIRDGEGPRVFRLGRRVLISAKALEEFVQQKEELGEDTTISSRPEVQSLGNKTGKGGSNGDRR